MDSPVIKFFLPLMVLALRFVEDKSLVALPILSASKLSALHPHPTRTNLMLSAPLKAVKLRILRAICVSAPTRCRPRKRLPKFPPVAP
jgi:hypothetical protein